MKYREYILILTIVICLALVMWIIFTHMEAPAAVKPSENPNTTALDNQYDSILSVGRRLFYINTDSSREFVLKGMATLPEGSPRIRMKLYNFIGATYQVQDNYEQALNYFYKALQLSPALADSGLMVTIYNNIGDLNQRTGNYKAAIGFLLKALHMDNAKGLSVSILNNIGTVYLSLEEYEKGEEYLRKAYTICRAQNDSVSLSTILNNLSTVFITRRESDSAMKYLSLSNAIALKTRNLLACCLVYNAYGDLFFSIDNPDKAIINYEQAKKIAIEINDPYREAYAVMGLARIMLRKEEADEALLYAFAAQAVANRLKNEVLLYECNRLFSEIYEQTGNFALSLAHFKEYISLRDQHVNQSSLRQVYNQEITMLNEDNRIKQLEIDRKSLVISRKNLLSFTITIIFVLSLLGIYFLFRNYKYRQAGKLHNLVVSLNEKKSRASSEAELLERKRIGRDLHDGLGQILSVTRLNISAINQRNDLTKERQTELIEAAISSIDNAFEELRQISHNLAPSVLAQMGLEGAINELVARINKSLKIKADFESYGIRDSLDQLIQNTLYRAVQELVNNVIKHAGAEHVTIQMVQSSHDINLMVEDDGTGFDFNRTHSELTSGGINNLKSRVENFHGTIFIDSTPNRGTIVTVTIPLTNT